jgi:hypothetical protein
MKAAPNRIREGCCRELMAGSQVRAPHGGAWRPAIITASVRIGETSQSCISVREREAGRLSPAPKPPFLRLSGRWRVRSSSLLDTMMRTFCCVHFDAARERAEVGRAEIPPGSKSRARS